MTTDRRFWSKVDRSTGCWEWRGARGDDGYGRFWDGTKVVRAHRFIYATEVAPIPEGMVIDHICRNRGCVRPSHLRVTTIKQNNENRGTKSSRSKSGYRGVSWDKAHGLWMAHLTHNYSFRFLGYFETAEAASEVASQARAEVFTHSTEQLSVPADERWAPVAEVPE